MIVKNRFNVFYHVLLDIFAFTSFINVEMLFFLFCAWKIIFIKNRNISNILYFLLGNVKYKQYIYIHFNAKDMKLYRGAKQGLNKMIGGSFYTEDYSIAESYAKLEENGIVYEFNISLRLFDANDFICASDIDEGIETIIEELENFDFILENYDGLYTQNGIQIILFGTIENNNFTKQSFVDLMNDVNAETRRYDR